jgi:serine/threonine-protein kinase
VNCPSCRAENEAAAGSCTACGATLVEPTEVFVTTVDLRAGTLFHGRYEIQSPLGRGGMGMVYQARDRTLDEVVAIKVLRPDFGQDPRMADRFRSEIKLARRVRHKNVCAIHDYGEDRGLLYISMELVDGVDLKKILREKGGLPAAEAYQLAIQVADGLQAVHDAGIIHRDLKSPNIMVDSKGVARLMDFGVAKRFGEGTVTATGNIVGTPEYMSPEQAQGRRLGFGSDIYALGIVVYEIFTGRVPFRGETPISTILKHINDPPPLDGPPATGIPPDLKPVLRRCLAKEPGERYASARETGEAFRDARSPSRRQVPVDTDALRAPTLPTAPTIPVARAAAPTVVTRVSRPALLPPWLLAVPVVAIGGGLVYMNMTGARPSPASSPATTAAVRPTEAPATTMTAVPTPFASPPPAVVAAVPVRPRPVSSPRPRHSPATAPPPSTVPAASPTPAPRSVVEAAPEAPGMLQVAVKPWGEVSVDGKVIGTTPLDRITLVAGSHLVRVKNPAFDAWEGRIVVRPGQTERLIVDLTQVGRKQ